MPSWLWGRSEGIQTFLRSGAQALAPLLFGTISDQVFGGGGMGLKWTFIIMLLPLAASAGVLFWAAKRYPRDVATAGLVTGPGTPEPGPTPPEGAGPGTRGRNGPEPGPAEAGVTEPIRPEPGTPERESLEPEISEPERAKAELLAPTPAEPEPTATGTAAVETPPKT